LPPRRLPACRGRGFLIGQSFLSELVREQLFMDKLRIKAMTGGPFGFVSLPQKDRNLPGFPQPTVFLWTGVPGVR
jgi:hypothetical protein